MILFFLVFYGGTEEGHTGFGGVFVWIKLKILAGKFENEKVFKVRTFVTVSLINIYTAQQNKLHGPLVQFDANFAADFNQGCFFLLSDQKCRLDSVEPKLKVADI